VTARLEASPVTIDFEGFKNIPPVFTSTGDIAVSGVGETIDGAYSGGVGSMGTKAANLGVGFSSNAEVLNDIDAAVRARSPTIRPALAYSISSTLQANPPARS